MAFVALAALASLALGLFATWHYAGANLTLSHYDAKAHLVVARRIFDSLTPGWRQIGAVWLPLPHVLDALPVQVDAWYRSGASGVAISLASFVLASTSLAWITTAFTGSRAAGAVALAVFATDPDLLYLQATPMTEPLLLGLVCLSLALVYRSYVRDGLARVPHGAGWAIVGACMTRYEAWPFAAALVGLAALLLLADGVPMREVARRIARLAAYPVGSVLAFAVLSRATVGEWFVTGGFFVVDNKAYRHPFLALVQVWWGTHQITGMGTFVVGLIGLGGLAAAAARRPRWRAGLLGLALLGCAALPWYAFFHGHPFRIRYMIVLATAIAYGAGVAVALVPARLRWLAATLAIVLACVEMPPLSTRAPMVAEAQWDVPNSRDRRAVTACLARDFRRPDEKILASMGSLAHYMQELSLAGFRLDDFIHEGIGQLWPEALASPRRHVEWILFEERAEGGDMLTALRRTDPAFVDGFTRVCEGGGVALYRRTVLQSPGPDRD